MKNLKKLLKEWYNQTEEKETELTPDQQEQLTRRFDGVIDKLGFSAPRILEELQDNNPMYDIYIGGGFLRDIYADKRAKDVDIFLIPKEDGVCPYPYLPDSTYVKFNKLQKDSEDMRNRGVSRLVGTSMYFGCYSDVDLVVYDKHLSFQELAADFDFGINQVAYSITSGMVTATKNFMEDHDLGIIQNYHNDSDKRQYDRFKRMTKKFTTYTVVDMPEEPPKEPSSVLVSCSSGAEYSA